MLVTNECYLFVTKLPLAESRRSNHLIKNLKRELKDVLRKVMINALRAVNPTHVFRRCRLWKVSYRCKNMSPRPVCHRLDTTCLYSLSKKKTSLQTHITSQTHISVDISEIIYIHTNIIRKIHFYSKNSYLPMTVRYFPSREKSLLLLLYLSWNMLLIYVQVLTA